jgi:large subunit ribosomal protein L21
MYAVIETGGKQYRVEVGTELEVELLDVEPGQSITLDRVLLVVDGADASVGTPNVADAAVEAEVVGATRGEKVIAFKYRPKARRRVMKGHRQDLTVLRIADIRLGSKRAADGKEAKASKADERKRVAEAAARQAAEDAALAAKLNVTAPEAEAPKAKATSKTEPKAEAKTEPKAKTKAAKVEETPAENAAEPEVEAPAKKTRAKAVKADAAEPATGAEDATADDAAGAEDTAAAPKKRASRTKKDE